MSTSHTLSIPSQDCDADKLSYFRFGAFQAGVILTTDQGAWHWLDKENFSKFLAGTLNEDSTEYQDLHKKGFVRANTNLEDLSQVVRRRKSFLGTGPLLHQIYLHDSDGRLSMETAKSIVDHAMQSTTTSLQFELIQGDALLDEDLCDFIVGYATEKNRYEKKELHWTLNTSLNELSENAAKVIAKHQCGIHTQLPEGTNEQNTNTI